MGLRHDVGVGIVDGDEEGALVEHVRQEGYHGVSPRRGRLRVRAGLDDGQER